MNSVSEGAMMKNNILRIVLMISIGLMPTIGFPDEIASGVHITPPKLDALINEQPYFGFATKQDYQKKADADFVAAVLAGGVTREQGAKRSTADGWRSIAQGGDWATAAKRFNQA
jgi:hypothetical protein